MACIQGEYFSEVLKELEMNKVTYMELVDQNSAKWYRVTLEDRSVTTEYGRIGRVQSKSTQEFPTDEEAVKFATRLAASKIKKGYVEIP